MQEAVSNEPGGFTKSADAIYSRLAAREGLYAVAFYGSQGSRKQYRRLTILWRAAMQQAYGHAAH
jgi:hypothetical protein